MNRLQTSRAKAALWRIDNPLKRQIIGGLGDKPQIGNGIANFCAFIKPRTLLKPKDSNNKLQRPPWNFELGTDHLSLGPSWDG